MAPLRTRQVLIWAGLPLTILLSYLWFKRKRNVAPPIQSDKDNKRPVDIKEIKKLEEDSKETTETSPIDVDTPSKASFSRSLSGIDSEPIDIVFPPEIRAKKPSPVIVSDEDLDLEIEKIKSMKVDNFGKKGGLTISPLKLHSSSKDVSVLEEENSSFVASTELNKEKKEENIESDSFEIIQKVQTDSSSSKTISSPEHSEKNMTKSKKRSGNDKVLKKMTAKDTKVENRKAAEIDNAIDETSVEKKLSSLHLDTKPIRNHPEEYHRTSCERDSANHSPADLMLASPSLSLISDNHSEGSSDSGKGGSEVVTPPPSRTPACEGSVSGDVPLHTIYQFLIPQAHVGRLIGTKGSFITQIKEKTRAYILIKKHPENSKLKICQIEGTQLEIDTALEMIRDKFPEKRFPDITLEQVSFLPNNTAVTLIPDHLCLKLIEGINNDTIVSCMVAPNHLFLQQPTHPTFPNLSMLSNCLNVCYADANSPLLPNPIPENTVCIAQSLGAWYRALVLSTDPENEISYVKFLDYGGYVNIPNSELRQIRADFLSLPFQASECFLANIRPIGGDDACWPDEAYTMVADIIKGSMLYTQVVGFAEDKTPLVHIYIVLGPQGVIFLNAELVSRGYAEWISEEDYYTSNCSVEGPSLTNVTEEQAVEVTTT